MVTLTGETRQCLTRALTGTTLADGGALACPWDWPFLGYSLLVWHGGAAIVGMGTLGWGDLGLMLVGGGGAVVSPIG